MTENNKARKRAYFVISTSANPPTGADALIVWVDSNTFSFELFTCVKLNERVNTATTPIKRIGLAFMR